MSGELSDPPNIKLSVGGVFDSLVSSAVFAPLENEISASRHLQTSCVSKVCRALQIVARFALEHAHSGTLRVDPESNSNSSTIGMLLFLYSE